MSDDEQDVPDPNAMICSVCSSPHASEESKYGDSFNMCNQHGCETKVSAPKPMFHMACGFRVADEKDIPLLDWMTCTEECFKTSIAFLKPKISVKIGLGEKRKAVVAPESAPSDADSKKAKL